MHSLLMVKLFIEMLFTTNSFSTFEVAHRPAKQGAAIVAYEALYDEAGVVLEA